MVTTSEQLLNQIKIFGWYYQNDLGIKFSNNDLILQ